MLGHGESKHGSGRSISHAELVRIIRQTRRRWRLKTLLRGAAIVLPAALAALLVSSYGMERYAFAPVSITVFRVITYLILVAAVVRFLVLPQLRRVSDEQVALYLEEHEPSLEAALVSAVELGLSDGGAGDHDGAVGGRGSGRRGPHGTRPELSPSLIRRLVEQAVERTHAVDDGRRIDRQSFRVATGGLAVTATVALLLFVAGPAFLRHGASALLFPWRQAEAATPYRIAVQPGSITVARGADQTVAAELQGFSAGEVDLLVRTGAEAAFERIPMAAAADSGIFEAFLFDLDEATEYFVEAGGVRSALYRIDVADLPYTRRLEHEYRFPAYTGLPPRTVEDAGDIAALQGTQVRFRVWTTVPTSGGRIVLDDGRTVALEVEAGGGDDGGEGGGEGGASGEGGALAGAIRVDREGTYRIELLGPDGQWVAGSPSHTIDVLEDQPPTVAFERPGRDAQASPIDELFVEARATDDYGIGRLQLVYQVNGGEEDTVELYTAQGEALKEVSAGHTLYLEEMDLRPGDFIAYHARAADNNRVGGQQEVTSDIYFVRIRPFRKDYRAAEQAGGMPGGGMEGEDAELSERQKEIIAATFNVVRDRARYPETEFREHLTTIALSQGRLREQVETLVSRMRSRGVLAADSGFAAILELLPRAAEEMKAAEERLGDREAREALPPEQRALQHLQRAEEVYREVQVAMGQQAGGGGGGSPNAEDLADLFELELDKLRNQYETVQRGREQEMEAQLDQSLERLKELARRQEQAAERQRRLARGQQGAGGGAGGQAQRQLADEIEEEARRLERLARENPQQGRTLEESARRLQEAADVVRRAATDPSGAGAQAARDRLEEARRLLERNRDDRLARAAQDALRRAEQLAAEQQEIAADVRRIGEEGGASPDRLRRLIERKDGLAADVADLERQLDRLAADATREELDASRKLDEAARSIRDNKLKEKIRFSRGVIQGRSPEYAEAFEREIGENFDELRDRLSAAAGAIASAGEEARQQEEALERARRLASGMQTLGERLRERAAEERTARRLDSLRARAQGGAEGEPQGGQGGQQGAPQGGQQGGQQGGRTGEPGATGQPGGRLAPSGGPGGSGFAPFGADDIRQFRREARERLAEAETLRQELARQGRDVADLSRIIESMRVLDSQRVYADEAEIERLQATIVEGLKRFEFGLRRELLGADPDRIFLRGAGEVPAGFEKLVEEYYRSLGRARDGR